jgi:flagella basal body P-ring formation protein FlgA
MNAPLTALLAMLAASGAVSPTPGHAPGARAGAAPPPASPILGAGAREAGSGGAVAVVTFRDTITVGARAIHLGDVAVVEGRDARLVGRLEGVEVGSAPLHGHSRTVSAGYAKVRIRQIGVDPAKLEFHGPELINVSRPEQVVTGASIRKAALAAIQAAHPGEAAELTSTLADLRLPVGAVQLQAGEVRPSVTSTGSLTVQILVAGQEEALVPVGFRIARLSPAVVAVRDLPAGQVLTEADLQVEPRPAAALSAVSDVAAAVGQQVAYPVRAGTALSTSMLRPVILVRRGDRVRLICHGPNFTATVTGEALQDAAAGQLVRVRNPGSLREVTGVVTGEQTAEVAY